MQKNNMDELVDTEEDTPIRYRTATGRRFIDDEAEESEDSDGMRMDDDDCDDLLKHTLTQKTNESFIVDSYEITESDFEPSSQEIVDVETGKPVNDENSSHVITINKRSSARDRNNSPYKKINKDQDVSMLPRDKGDVQMPMLRMPPVDNYEKDDNDIKYESDHEDQLPQLKDVNDAPNRSRTANMAILTAPHIFLIDEQSIMNSTKLNTINARFRNYVNNDLYIDSDDDDVLAQKEEFDEEAFEHALGLIDTEQLQVIYNRNNNVDNDNDDRKPAAVDRHSINSNRNDNNHDDCNGDKNQAKAVKQDYCMNTTAVAQRQNKASTTTKSFP
jgi:hypothetical protein